MKTKLITILALLLLPIILNAQDRIPVQLNNIQLNLNLLTSGISLEKSISGNTSATFGGGLSPLYSSDNEVSINPFVRTSFRNYYPRKKVKKELNPNSGNYIGLVGGYYFGSVANSSESAQFNQSDSYYLGAMWGIQRNYKSGIHLGFSLGGGFGEGENMNLEFIGVGEFEFGFVLK